MRARDVEELLGAFAAAGVEMFLDGGWGVDALAGQELRAHKDLDVVVRVEQVGALLKVLKARGYRVVAGGPPFGFVGKDCEGRLVDVTPITVADDGSACYRGPNQVERSYGPNAFTAYGTIDGTVVRCLTPAAQMDAHVGYAFDQKDVNEVWLLHDQFGVTIPDEYADTRPTT